MPLVHLNNFIFLRKIEKNPVTYKGRVLSKEVAYSMARHTKETYKRKNSNMRNLAASAIKKVRAAYPFEPTDYSVAKSEYEAYFQMEGHINLEKINKDFSESAEPIYLKKFRENCPAKGERYCEYFLNQDGCIARGVFVMSEPLSHEFYTAYRYATEEEIKLHKEAREKQKAITAKIEKKANEMEKLWGEYRALEKI